MRDYIRITNIFIEGFGAVDLLDMPIRGNVIVMPEGVEKIDDIRLALTAILTQDYSETFRSKLQEYTYIGIMFECGGVQYHYKFLYNTGAMESDQECHILFIDKKAIEAEYADDYMARLMSPMYSKTFGGEVDVDAKKMMGYNDILNEFVGDMLAADIIEGVDGYMALYPDDKEAIITLLERKYGIDRPHILIRDLVCYLDERGLNPNIGEDKTLDDRGRLAMGIASYGILELALGLWTLLDEKKVSIPPLMLSHVFGDYLTLSETIGLVESYITRSGRQVFISDDTDHVMAIWHDVDALYMREAADGVGIIKMRDDVE